MDGEGVQEVSLDSDQPTIELEPGVEVTLAGVDDHLMERKPFCKACGRGDTTLFRPVPQAKLAVDAPRDVVIIRGEARRKTF